MMPQRKPLGILDPNVPRIQPPRVAKKEHRYFASRRSKEFTVVENKKNIFQLDQENCTNTNAFPSQRESLTSRSNYFNNLNKTEGIQRIPLQTLVNKTYEKSEPRCQHYENGDFKNIQFFSPITDSPNSSCQSMSTSFESDESFHSNNDHSRTQDEISYLFSTSAAVESPSAMDRISNNSQCKMFELLKAKTNDVLSVDNYTEDAIQHLILLEAKYLPKPHYLEKQSEVTSEMRTKLIDWLAEVQEEYSLEHESFQLAVAYVDLFLSTMSVTRSKLQLLGTTCMFVGAKYEEIYPPSADEFSYVTADTYTRHEVLLFEKLLLKTFKYRLWVPTSHQFLDIFHSESCTSDDCYNLSLYLSDLMLLDEKYLIYPPSIRAAASFSLAIATIIKARADIDDLKLDNNPSSQSSSKKDFVSIPAIVKKFWGTKLTEMFNCIKDLANTHMEEDMQRNQSFITEKYASEQFNYITNIVPLMTSPDCLETTEIWDKTIAMWLT